MPRIPLRLTNLTTGLTLKASLLGEPSMVRCENWKIVRAGVLRRRGGFDDWDTPSTDYGRMLGIKRWYREDGGVNFVFVATTTAGSPQVWSYALHNKTSSSLGTIAETVDPDGIVLWVDCGSVLMILADQSKGAPYSLRLKGQGGEGGLHFSQSGLAPNPDPPFLTASIISDGNPTNHESRTNLGLSDGVYQYVVTRCYGTKENPLKWGESAPSPSHGITIDNSAVVQKGKVTVDINESSSGLNIVHRFHIYRTLANGSTFYRVGVIEQPNIQTWVDTVNDTDVNLSLVLPTLTGLPPKIRCGLWDKDRLWAFGEDGTLHPSEAGHPDVFPAGYRSVIGSLGHRANGVVLIRDNKYALKEDGIYLILGSVPNISYRKIDDVRCYSRGSVVEMPGGVYFLGDSDQDGAGVYRFNGNSAVRISEQIAETATRKDSYFYKKAVGKRVGNEYWLSLISEDRRQISHQHPFNNVTLCYDPRYNSWSTLQNQAAGYEVFDGPGDAQEIFMLEADIAAGATGNFFRFNSHKSTGPQTTYIAGSRVYDKAITYYSHLEIGPLVRGLERHIPRKLIVLMRGYNSQPLLFATNGNLYGTVTLGAGSAEPTYLERTIVDISKWGTSTWTTGVNAGIWKDISFVNRYEFNLDRPEHEQEVTLRLQVHSGIGATPEIEGLEYLYEGPDPEDKRS